MIDGISYLTETGFYHFGNLYFQYSFSGPEIIFNIGDVHIFTITNGTGKFLGCEGFIKHDILQSGVRKITIGKTFVKLINIF